MSTENTEQEPGQKRANEVMEAMRNVPGYADDSLLFIARYGSKVKDSIRTEEYTEFNELTAQLNVANGKGEKLKAAEARTKALALIAEYPDLVRDYDKFTTAARTMAAAVWSKVPKDKQK